MQYQRQANEPAAPAVQAPLVQPPVVQGQPAPPVMNAPLNQQTTGGRFPHLMAKTMTVLGIIQVLIGFACIVFAIAGIALHVVLSQVGHGIWCSVFFILAGSFAILAGNKKTMCFVVTTLVLTIIAAVFTIPMMTVSAIGWANEEYNDYYWRRIDYPYRPTTTDHWGNHYGYGYDYDYDYSKIRARQTMNALLVVLAVLNGILAIITSCLTCHGLCCGGGRGTTRVPAVGYLPSGQAVQLVVIQGPPGAQQMVPFNPQQTSYVNSPPINYPQAQPVVYPTGPPQQQPMGQAVAPPYYNGDQPPAFNSVQPQTQVPAEPAKGPIA